MTSKISQIEIDVLGGVLGSKARAKVLRALLVDPRRAYYQRQLARACDLTVRAVQRELERFTEYGLLFRRVEGKRAYYQVDTSHVLFAVLRDLVLATADPLEQLRGALAMDDFVRAAILLSESDHVLVVTRANFRFTAPLPGERQMTTMTADAFREALGAPDESLKKFLSEGEDILGRRDDLIWHWIESAGYSVPTRKEVP